MEKRLLTKRQERALKLCHHDFDGLTQEEAAKIMGINRKNISKLLFRVEKIAPQLFPILTKQESKIFHYYMVEGWDVEEIAEYMDITINAIYLTFRRLRNKDSLFKTTIGRIISLDKWLAEGGDERKIKHKF